MKKSFLIAAGLGLPVLWFAAYVLLVVVGCVAFSCGADQQFYCGFYCKFGMSLLIAVSGVAGYMLYKAMSLRTG